MTPSLNIKKKLLILILMVIIVPMTILMYLTDLVLQHQMHTEEAKFLQSTLVIARSEMQERRNDITKSCICLAKDTDAQRYIREGNYMPLVPKLRLIQKNFTKVDYAIVVDANSKVLAAVSPAAVYDSAGILGSLAREAMDNRKPITCTETIPLKGLFREDSADFSKFSIELNEGIAGKGEHLNNALIEATVVPIEDNFDSSQVLGAVILVGIANSDYYFPQYIASRATEGFLALTVDGVVVATKATLGEEKDYLVGTQRKIDPASKPSVTGVTIIGGVTYLVADEAITNHEGKPVGYISIGIPEKRFSVLITDNRSIIMATIFLCLVLCIPLGQFLSRSISTPIVEVTKLAQDASQQFFGTTNKLPEDVQDEAAILYESFNGFITNLKNNELEKASYIEKLEEEHRRQTELARQLQATNETLELKVAERTSYLQSLVTNLQKLDVAKSQFLANLSHELRTPLSVIINACDILKQQIFGPLNEKQNKYIHSAFDCGNHLLELINNLLDLSKMAAGKMTLNREEFKIRDLVMATIESTHSLIKDKNTVIKLEVNPENLVINADAQRMKQIFYNLLSNSIKFTNNDGRIDVMIYQRGENMDVVVKDNGIGISEADQKRVFSEFEQADNSAGKRYEGTGLGLPIVKQLVELHGGHIYLTSKENVGTEIIFNIPVNYEEPITSDGDEE